mmetsp:Transcript_29820/g.65644  ORF Transcript_29820/g.65644 Transcript_29820/m.65644 type:complete len:82 (+) Transcript_29820:1661-1906(+)
MARSELAMETEREAKELSACSRVGRSWRGGGRGGASTEEESVTAVPRSDEVRASFRLGLPAAAPAAAGVSPSAPSISLELP